MVQKNKEKPVVIDNKKFEKRAEKAGIDLKIEAEKFCMSDEVKIIKKDKNQEK